VSRKDDHWQVTVKDLTKCNTFEVAYDAIIVCNGTYATPKIPQINGIERFNGKIIHTHDYRVADSFKGEKVLVLGAGPSGIDIALELSELCVSVILCHQLDRTYSNLPENIIEEKDTIQCITENGVIMKSGTCYSLDTIVFATGYYLDYKFLNTNCNIKVNDHARVEGIYLHFINISHPSMAIMGIPCHVIPFILFHQQVNIKIYTSKK
jgi:dimethylaniline monooxygenase (N-oxide forming)